MDNLLGVILFFIVISKSSSQILGRIQFMLLACGSNNLRVKELPGQLDGGSTHTAARCMDKNRITFPKRAQPDQRLKSRQECFGNSGGFGKVDSLRHGQSHVFMDSAILSIAPAGQEAKDAVPDLPLVYI